MKIKNVYLLYCIYSAYKCFNFRHVGNFWQSLFLYYNFIDNCVEVYAYFYQYIYIHIIARANSYFVL